jgi:hypothetical protein
MFAPYCETCQSRILLSTRSIVHFFSPDRVVLACVCGNHVDAFARKPSGRGADQVRADQVRADQVRPLASAAS